MTSVNNNLFVRNYKKVALDMLRLSFPQLTIPELEYGIDLAIKENIQDHAVVLDNNYKKTQVNTTLLEMANYIISREPIITTYGTMFSKHGVMQNPIYDMIDGFITGRDKAKKEMFSYPKGSPDFQRLNLIQLLLKLDANA